MTSFFRPLLAAPADLAKLTFPLIASPKVDGIRCICHPTLGPVSRSLKPIPNRRIREELSKPEYLHLDGEIVVGDPTSPLSFNRTTEIMRHEGEPEGWHLLVFDHIAQPRQSYVDRLEDLESMLKPPKASLLEYVFIENPTQLDFHEERYVSLGYEGMMLRKPSGPYKFGRSTQKEGTLLKLKRWTDADARIIGFEELMHNENPQEQSELGLAKRSSAASGLIPAGKLGALIVSHPKWGEFNLGSGFTDAQRVEFWQRRKELLQTLATFKYQPHGMLDKPRTPIFLRLRPEE
jgi:DNA ligase-1